MPKTAKRRKATARSRVARSQKRTSARSKARKTRKGKPAARFDPLLAPVNGAERRNVGHVQLDVGRAGDVRVKRMIYPPGFRWSVDMKPAVGTELCMHAHVGFLVRGEIHIEYADGCIVEHKAPHVIGIEPGHDGWVVGKEPVVMIEFDFENDTIRRTGMPVAHKH